MHIFARIQNKKQNKIMGISLINFKYDTKKFDVEGKEMDAKGEKVDRVVR